MARVPFKRHYATRSWPWFRSTLYAATWVLLTLMLRVQVAAAEQPHDDEWEAVEARPTGNTLVSNAGWGVGLDGQSGFSVLRTGEGGVARLTAGGLARVRWNLLQVGGSFERSESYKGAWQSLGGFVGVWLPYRRWVDFDVAAGLASRVYRNADPRYGVSGYSLVTPALTFRAGISDRSSESFLGVRIGAALVGTVDLKRHRPAWRYEFAAAEGQTPRAVTGVGQVGGFSLGVVVTVGLEMQEPR